VKKDEGMLLQTLKEDEKHVRRRKHLASLFYFCFLSWSNLRRIEIKVCEDIW
jgi:hypothetical protein